MASDSKARGLTQYLPILDWLPRTIVVVVLGIVVSAWLGLADYGVTTDSRVRCPAI